jgi:DNA-binding transcriptional LysR family regulator
MFDLRQLRYFVAVAEALSFTEAARRLHLSQPPLSQQIRALEQDLGVQLLERTKRRVALTEPGRQFLEEARKVLQQVETARSRAVGAAAGYSGRLRLAYPASVAFHPALPATVLRFSEAAPAVRLELTEMYTGAQYRALAAGEIDAGLVRSRPDGEPEQAEIDLLVLDREPLLLALPVRHPLARRRRIHIADVAGDNFVAQPRVLSTTLHDILFRLAARSGFHPVIRQEAQQVTGLLALVAAGIGLALVPASLRAVQLQDVRLVPVADEGASQLLAVASRRGDTSPVLARFLETVRPLRDLAGPACDASS